MSILLNEQNIKMSVCKILDSLVAEVISSNADRLKSAVLYGSVLGNHFVEGKSDINLLLVFDRVDFSLLKNLKVIFKKYRAKMRTNPVVVDYEYIKTSTDVFPMEFLEWKENHLVIFGEEIFKDLKISFENLRLEVEENLKGKMLRLIQSYFEVYENTGRFRTFLEMTVPNFIVVFRNILRLKKISPAQDILPMLEQLEKETGINIQTTKKLIHLKRTSEKLSTPNLEELFENYFSEIKKITEFVDVMGK